ncbi:MAG: DUF5106 domain-containing protein [Flavobacteriales bacterium]|nr:DUF5106 domain-containing protein [Flavobacteriales bacterium]
MRHLLPLLVFAFASTACSAQKGSGEATSTTDRRRLEFVIKGGEKDSIFLANYYGNKLYYSDTAVSDAKGRVVFDRAKGYKAGVYAVVVPGPKYFEILVNEPSIVMETDTANLSEGLIVKKSHENQVFLSYVRFINKQRKEAEGVNKEREATVDTVKKSQLRERLVAYEKSIKDYQLDLIAKNPGTYVATIVRMSISPDQEAIRLPDGTLDSSATYYSYRTHFWDNTDLADERILRTPVFQNKFDEYISKVVPQIPDTINKCADDLIRRMDHGEELFKFAVHTITYKYETSDIMGMDAVFVHMAQTYYCPNAGKPGRATWLSSDKLDKLCERARKQAPIIIGAQAKNIILPDTTEQNWINMYKLPQEYVLVVFWDPHCGHCKKTLPDLYTQYKEKLRPLNVEVCAVSKATDSTLFADWKAFIRENKMDWVNIGLTWNVYQEAKQNPNKYIPKLTTIESLNYADAWDVYSTPKIFLLDAERKIVGKQLTPDQMVDLIANLKKRKQRELDKGK